MLHFPHAQYLISLAVKVHLYVTAHAMYYLLTWVFLCVCVYFFDLRFFSGLSVTVLLMLVAVVQ